MCKITSCTCISDRVLLNALVHSKRMLYN